MTTLTRKPCQQYRSGYRLKDGRIFLARCSPRFYGTVTPGFCIDANGESHSGVVEIDNTEMVDPNTAEGQWGQVAYYEGNAVGLSTNARPKTQRERKQRVRITLLHIAPDAYITLSRIEFNRKVRFRWERIDQSASA